MSLAQLGSSLQGRSTNYQISTYIVYGHRPFGVYETAVADMNMKQEEQMHAYLYCCGV